MGVRVCVCVCVCVVWWLSTPFDSADQAASVMAVQVRQLTLHGPPASASPDMRKYCGGERSQFHLQRQNCVMLMSDVELTYCLLVSVDSAAQNQLV